MYCPKPLVILSLCALLFAYACGDDSSENSAPPLDNSLCTEAKEGVFLCHGKDLMKCSAGSWVIERQCKNETACKNDKESCEERCLTQDELKCDGKELMKRNNGNWKLEKVCINAAACTNDQMACEAPCEANIVKCDGKDLMKCSDGDWVTERRCTSEAGCINEQTACEEACLENSYLCMGRELMTCRDRLWVSHETCNNSDLCHAERGQCDKGPVETACTRDDGLKCDTSGKLELLCNGETWQSSRICSNCEEFCEKPDRNCNLPGGYKIEQGIIYRCRDTSPWFKHKECETGTFFDAIEGRCSEKCIAQSLRCQGNVIEFCNADGDFITYSTCDKDGKDAYCEDRGREAVCLDKPSRYVQNIEKFSHQSALAGEVVHARLEFNEALDKDDTIVVYMLDQQGYLVGEWAEFAQTETDTPITKQDVSFKIPQIEADSEFDIVYQVKTLEAAGQTAQKTLKIYDTKFLLRHHASPGMSTDSIFMRDDISPIGDTPYAVDTVVADWPDSLHPMGHQSFPYAWHIESTDEQNQGIRLDWDKPQASFPFGISAFNIDIVSRLKDVDNKGNLTIELMDGDKSVETCELPAGEISDAYTVLRCIFKKEESKLENLWFRIAGTASSSLSIRSIDISFYIMV